MRRRVVLAATKAADAASLGIVYKLSRTMQLKGELREVWLRSNVSGVDYTATAVLVGLRFQR